MPRRCLLVLTVATLAAASAAVAQNCVDYGAFIRVTSNASVPGSARQAVVVQQHAFLASGTAGLTVFDLADPDAPQLVVQDDRCANALWVAHHEQHVFVADNTGGLHVYDVADPRRPIYRAMITMPSTGQDLLVRPPHLLVAAGQAGLLVIDITVPTAPIILGQADTPGLARGVAAGPDVAVVADDDQGLAVIDIASPQQPRVVGRIDTAGVGYAVALDGDMAHLAAWTAGLEIIDISVRHKPQLASRVPLPGVARKLVLRDGLAFVAAGDLTVVDVALPDLPRVVGRAATSGGPIAVTLLDEQRALVTAGDGGLDVVDIDPPSSPPRLADLPLGGVTLGLATTGPLTVVGADDLHLIDTTDPGSPQPLATLPFTGNTSRLAIEGDRAYVTTAGEGGARLLIADIADPANPTWLSSLPAETFVSPISPNGTVVYLSDFFYGGLLTVDVSDPARPEIIDTQTTSPFAQQLLRLEHHLLVGTGAFGGATIQTFDVTTPRSPALAATLPLAALSVRGLAAGDTAVFAIVQIQENQGELLTLEASNPTNLVVMNAHPLAGDLLGLAVHDQLAYVADSRGLVRVLDVADPTSPRAIGQTFLAHGAVGLVEGGGSLYAAATESGLGVLPLHCGTSVGVEGGDGPDTPPTPTGLKLTAHPNPFNPQVTLQLSLTRAGLVQLTVHDLRGRQVANLVRDHLQAGDHTVVWDGRHADGRAAPSGRYLARVVTTDRQRSVGLTLVK